MLLFEDPLSHTLWFGKALMREWLLPGKAPVVLEHSPTRYGRVSFSISPTTAGANANITLPKLFKWPEGGIKLRVRNPAFNEGTVIKSVTVGGKPVTALLPF